MRDSRKRSPHNAAFSRYFAGSVTPGRKDEAGDPEADKIAKLLDSLHDAALEETVRPQVGIVLLREYVGSQENGTALCGTPLHLEPLGDAPAHRTICREKPALAEK